ncbi:TrbC/VirB2 family protein [Candidatus Woesearchaeota archaeon]|nr:TrbC/VirB2 family protein [Candidatus Woesearchaeota archaeon]
MKWQIVVLALLVLMPSVFAYGFNDTISDEDKATFDEILVPVMKIYDFVKYSATVIAVVVLLFAGVKFMMHGNDPRQRDDAKHMAMYVVIGLVIIWGAPLIVEYIIA